MNIRKLILPMIVAAMALTATTCFARVSMSNLNIGGFYYGQPWDEVVKKSSTIIRQSNNKTAEEYFLSDARAFKTSTWECYAIRGKDGTVTGVSTSMSCNISTNKGIRLDLPVEDVIAAYGQPDMIVKRAGQKRTLVYLTDTGTCVLSFVVSPSLFSPRREIVERISFGTYSNANSSGSRPQTRQ